MRAITNLPDGVCRVVCLGTTHYYVNVFDEKHSQCHISFYRHHQDWYGPKNDKDERINISGVPYHLTTEQAERLLCKLQMMVDFSKVAPRLLMRDWPPAKENQETIVEPDKIAGYCNLCRTKEIELFGAVVHVVGPEHERACKEAGCKHPVSYKNYPKIPEPLKKKPVLKR